MTPLFIWACVFYIDVFVLVMLVCVRMPVYVYYIKVFVPVMLVFVRIPVYLLTSQALNWDVHKLHRVFIFFVLFTLSIYTCDVVHVVPSIREYIAQFSSMAMRNN